MEQQWLQVHGLAVREPSVEEEQRHRLSGKNDTRRRPAGGSGYGINDAWARKDSVLPILEENIRAVIAGDTEAQLAEVDSEIKHLQTELLSVGNDQSRIDEIGDSIISLREERQAILSDAAARQGLRDRLNDLVSFLDEQTEAITEYSETPVRRLVEKITIFDEKITVAFKSKLKIDVDA